MLKEVIIQAISPDPTSSTGGYTLYLLEKENNNVVLPIQIGMSSAHALALALQKSVTPRPHIHDTMRRAINALSAHIVHASVCLSSDKIFYALIRIRKKNEVYDIDSKVTDAFGLAIRCGAPLFVENDVLKSDGVVLSPV